MSELLFSSGRKTEEVNFRKLLKTLPVVCAQDPGEVVRLSRNNNNDNKYSVCMVRPAFSCIDRYQFVGPVNQTIVTRNSRSY